ncbi:cupin domain-containing protein [Colwellia sp. MB3u-4]|uniref:cupin domain-containing protein n=1 Tax=Colwellia sp. MB3u-4 TaxID=2759822 RepID=UPI0015F41B61|nr:cupin domain-containing protein [Colwellia sp. MB3u-4]MBA6289490.1 cupin domain-containing protein [Colwellia sp. MB3u-4]
MKNLFGILCLFLVLSTIVFAEDTNKVIVETLTKTSLSWDGSELSAYPEGKPEVTILRITIPQGSELPMHKHLVINAGILLKGELTVITKENKTLHLKAGSSIVEVVDKWHYGKNEGEIPAEIIVFYAGVAGTPITIK